MSSVHGLSGVHSRFTRRLFHHGSSILSALSKVLAVEQSCLRKQKESCLKPLLRFLIDERGVAWCAGGRIIRWFGKIVYISSVQQWENNCGAHDAARACVRMLTTLSYFFRFNSMKCQCLQEVVLKVTSPWFTPTLQVFREFSHVWTPGSRCDVIRYLGRWRDGSKIHFF